jgi:hypothetical protein
MKSRKKATSKPKALYTVESSAGYETKPAYTLDSSPKPKRLPTPVPKQHRKATDVDLTKLSPMTWTKYSIEGGETLFREGSFAANSVAAPNGKIFTFSVQLDVSGEPTGKSGVIILDPGTTYNKLRLLTR